MEMPEIHDRYAVERITQVEAQLGLNFHEPAGTCSDINLHRPTVRLAIKKIISRFISSAFRFTLWSTNELLFNGQETNSFSCYFHPTSIGYDLVIESDPLCNSLPPHPK